MAQVYPLMLVGESHPHTGKRDIGGRYRQITSENLADPFKKPKSNLPPRHKKSCFQARACFLKPPPVEDVSFKCHVETPFEKSEHQSVQQRCVVPKCAQIKLLEWRPVQLSIPQNNASCASSFLPPIFQEHLRNIITKRILHKFISGAMIEVVRGCQRDHGEHGPYLKSQLLDRMIEDLEAIYLQLFLIRTWEAIFLGAGK